MGIRADAESEQVAARVRELLGRAADEPAPQLETSVHGVGHAAGSGWADLRDRVLARVPMRVDPGRRTASAVGVAMLLAAVLTGIWLISQRPKAMTVSADATPVAGAQSPSGTDAPYESAPAASPLPSSAAPAAAASSSATDLVVDVAGKVAHPGVYQLPNGSRVDDALQAAGGARRGVSLSDLNLAALLVDGEQIPVGIKPAAGGGLPAGSGAVPGTVDGAVSGSSSGAVAIVDLNTATLEQLETLPGIGPALGQRILDWRTQHGSFATVTQLNDVSGIGEITFGRLQPLVTV